jgi:PilZ domain
MAQALRAMSTEHEPPVNQQGDSRVSRRFSMHVEVQLLSRDLHHGYSEDIGRDGMFVSSRHLLRPGDQLRVRFTVPEMPVPIEPVCEVRWVRDAEAARASQLPSGMGLYFTRLSPLAAAVIDAYLNRQQMRLSDGLHVLDPRAR